MKKILMVGVVVALLMALTIPSAVTLASNGNAVGDAIADGVAWLADQQNPDGSWGLRHPVSETGLAVLILTEHAVDSEHGYGLDSPFDPAYPYGGHVQEGLNYLFANAWLIEIHEQPAGDPDTNGNGLGVWFGATWHRIYNTSIAMMGIAGSRAPGKVVDVPGSPVHGWTYYDVLQDAVDYLAFGQNDSSWEQGGWGYLENYTGWSDQSNTGWATFGLGFAESPDYGFGCTVPAFVKAELDIWIQYIQNRIPGDPDHGGAGYGPWEEWEWANTLKTGHLLYMMALVGDTALTARVQDAVDYLVRHWDQQDGDPGWRGWPGESASYQATFNVMKGLDVLGIDEIGGIDWYSDLAEVLVSQQLADGSWPRTSWDYALWEWDEELEDYVIVAEPRILSTTWALLTLQRVTPRPVPVEVCVDLIAGQHIVAGKVCVYNDGENLYVTYTTIDGWMLAETHLAVSTDEPGTGEWLGNRWQNRAGNPAPGQFPHKERHRPSVETFAYTIPLSEITDGVGARDTVFVAAQAVVVHRENGKESAWGDGERFVQHGDWAMFFEYIVR